MPVVRIFALRIAYPSSVGDIHGSTRAKTIAHCSQCVKQRLINGAEEIQEDTWEGIGWRGNRGNISGDPHPPYNPLPEGEETALGQAGRAHEITVALSGSAASLVDSPDHQALTAPHVPGSEDPRHIRSVVVILSFSVRAVVALDA